MDGWMRAHVCDGTLMSSLVSHVALGDDPLSRNSSHLNFKVLHHVPPLFPLLCQLPGSYQFRPALLD